MIRSAANGIAHGAALAEGSAKKHVNLIWNGERMPSNTSLMPAKVSTADQPLGALEDKALVDAAQSGNSLAFIELCQRHSKRLVWRINRITRNWEDAEDALQDTFLRAYRNLDRFENRCAFSSWLTRIGINSALMLLRRRRGVAVSLDQDYEFLEIHESKINIPVQRSVDPESLCEWQEQLHLLKTAIRSLPRLLRTVTEMKIDRDCSVGEIARALGISEAAVKSRLARARSRLREALIGVGPESDSRRPTMAMLLGPAPSRIGPGRPACGFDGAA